MTEKQALTPSDISAYKAAKDLLLNKTILVTGAGSGIGKAAALAFAQHGATVVLVGRTLNKLEAVYDEIEAYECPQPAIFPINFESAQEHDYKALHDALESEFGKLDGVLHNAAELGPRTPLENYALENWAKVLHVNVTAPFLLSKFLLPLLKKADHASILFTSSSVATRGRAFWGAYSVSKAAGENLMQILSDELDEVSQIRVNTINPGATRTPMRASAYPAEDPSTIKEAESIMPGYLYFMGDDSLGVMNTRLDLSN